MATLTKDQLDEVEELLERKRALAGESNQLENLSSSLRSAQTALGIAAGQAESSIGRVGLDMMLDDLQTIIDMTRANAQRVWQARQAAAGQLDFLTAKGHQPVVTSMPVWSLYGTRRVTCQVCGQDVTLSGKWDEVRDRPGIRHYTDRRYR